MESRGIEGVSPSQSRTIDVGQGIFALRYVASAALHHAPRILVEPFATAGLSLIAAPGSTDFVLDAPGDCILIRAERPARVKLTATGRTAAGLPDGGLLDGGLLDADLRLERVTSPGAPHETGEPEVDVLAHLARRGDVAFPMDAWIGGPALPSRIEGLMLRWANRPADADLLCTVVSRGRRLRRFPNRATGAFAGTRGEAAPIVGLEIALTGPGAERYALSGEAQFLGEPTLSASGTRLRFASASGREPLVGLKFALTAVRAPSGPDVRPPSGPSVRPIPGQVRVFRRSKTPA